MLIQPKILTVVIASDDLARTYTTIRSLQQMRYRNHEIVCVIAAGKETIRRHVQRDFNWLPIIYTPYASLSTLLQEAVERGRYSYVDGICFVQAGTTVDGEFLAKMVEPFKRHTTYAMFMPAVVRPEGKSIAYGAESKGLLPHQLRTVTELPDGVENLEDSHFLGPVCLLRAKTCYRYTFSEINDDLALLYWTETLIGDGVHTLTLGGVTVFYDGVLYSDLNDALIVPAGWYRDLERYIDTNGTWYDKADFWLRFRWRREGSLVARLIETWWQGGTVYRTPEE